MNKLLDFVPVRVSSKWCRIKFYTCGPECYEKKGCHGICCDPHKSSNLGPRVYVTPKEAKTLKRKYKIKSTNEGFLVPKKGCNLCPFKGKTYKCTIHFTGYKPLGCIVSPFAINKNNTLIIRHRYIHLPCRDDNGRPAYKAFKDSLIAIFGERQVRSLTRHLNAGLGDKTLKVPKHIYNDITQRESSIRHEHKKDTNT